WETPEALDLLKKQLKRPVAGTYDGYFAVLLRDTGYSNADTSKRPNKVAVQIMDKLRKGPTPLHEIAMLGRGEKILQRLVDEGRAVISGFTPSDASHVLGKQSNWNTEAAQLGAQLFLRRIFDQGFWEMAQTVEEFSELVFERAVVDSAKTVAGAVLGEHYGIEPDPNSKLAQFLLETAAGSSQEPFELEHDDHYPDPLSMSIKLNRPLLAIGAPAKTYYGGKNGAAKRLNAKLIDLPHADVANAVGAVVGSVKGTAVILITEPESGLFRAHSDSGVEDFRSLEAATTYGEKAAVDLAQERARERGASETDTSLIHDDIIVEVSGGLKVFVESKLTATAHGRPDLGV
ncbi:MAG: hypothetical protein HON65_05650, partial [Rhodospirillales bacterium]|nr:hypothetical protein [Rhodospirillales bacterium]